MSLTISLHQPKEAMADHSGSVSWVSIYDVEGAHVCVFCARHVADHVAAAFNRASEAKKLERGGYQYDTPAGAWFIDEPNLHRGGWWIQHEDAEETIDSDGTRHRSGIAQSADATTLIGVMDEIDEMINLWACHGCERLGRELHELSGEMLCLDCIEKRAERAQALHEAAGDDRAHAERIAAE